MHNNIIERMQDHLNNLTKPVGSLGELENIAMKLALIQNTIKPGINKMAAFIFAADHGISEEKISMYPKEVTYQMVLNFINGGAGINVLAKHCGYDVFVVDAGVDGDFSDKKIINKKAGYGTKNFHKQPAMTDEELNKCIENGKNLAQYAADKGYNLIVPGDMGIGNTSTAAAILIASGIPSDDVIDRGTGIDDEMLNTKRRVIQESIKMHAPYLSPMDILKKLGGFELATITGFILGLADKNIACVIDGFPVSSAVYMAYLIDKRIKNFLFAGHKSKVKGHTAILKELGLSPIVDLKMRLGEGSGGVIGGFIVKLSSKIACEMASFKDAGVSGSEKKEKNF